MKTSIMLTLAGTVVALASLVTYLIVTDRDPVLLLTVLVTLIPVLGALFLGQKTVQQTNGTNTALRQESAAKTQEIIALRSVMTPEQAALVPITPPIISAIPVDGTYTGLDR